MVGQGMYGSAQGSLQLFTTRLRSTLRKRPRIPGIRVLMLSDDICAGGTFVDFKCTVRHRIESNDSLVLLGKKASTNAHAHQCITRRKLEVRRRKLEGRRWKSEDRSRKLEGRRWKLRKAEDRSKKTEAGWKSEDRSWKAEDERQKMEVRRWSWKAEDGSWKAEDGSQKTEIRRWKVESVSWDGTNRPPYFNSNYSEPDNIAIDQSLYDRELQISDEHDRNKPVKSMHHSCKRGTFYTGIYIVKYIP